MKRVATIINDNNDQLLEKHLKDRIGTCLFFFYEPGENENEKFEFYKKNNLNKYI